MTYIPKILIVDDQPQNIQVIGNLLRDYKYKSGFSTSGKNALELLEKSSFDLILLDINMPQINGFEVCKQIRSTSTHPNYDTPIIFLTAKIEKESILTGFQLGGQDYVTKPFNNEELLARVQTQIALQLAKRELKELNENLENQVQERTKKIQLISNKLQYAHEELKIMDQVKGEFIRAISHELRTPLTGILGFTEILLTDLQDTEFEDKVNLLKVSAERLNNLSYKALLISELKTKEYLINKKVVNGTLLITQEIHTYNHLIREKNIQLNTNLPENVIIEIDTKLFVLGLKEILENALKHCSTNGTINVSIKVSDNETSINISNSGAQFPTEIIKAPENFLRPKPNGTEKSVGFGLVIVSLSAKLHKAKLILTNEENFASVTFILPNIQN